MLGQRIISARQSRQNDHVIARLFGGNRTIKKMGIEKPIYADEVEEFWDGSWSSRSSRGS